MTQAKIELGDKGADGRTIEINRGIDDGTELPTVIKYVCHGVEKFDVDDPWNSGMDTCVIHVTFSDGGYEVFDGVIVDVRGGSDE